MGLSTVSAISCFFFPPLSDIASLLAGTSLLDLGLEVVGLVCSNIAAGNNRHYWLVECSQGRPQTAYDSLKKVFKKSLGSFFFFCWRLLGLTPGGTPFSQLDKGVCLQQPKEMFNIKFLQKHAIGHRYKQSSNKMQRMQSLSKAQRRGLWS